MPFKSEDQRRYLWANEPEIARDWTDTYGSRIQNNTGGISRLGFEEGSPKKEIYDLEQYKKEKGMIDQWMYDQMMEEGRIEQLRRKKVREQKTLAATGGIMSMQGGVQNHLGHQKEVTAPLNWQSSPDHPTTELAYITKPEKELLVEQDLHNSLKGGVNRGPSGIMSLNGWGSSDPEQNVAGSAISESVGPGGKITTDFGPAGGGSSAVASQAMSPAQLGLLAGQKGSSTVMPASFYGKEYKPQGFFSNLKDNFFQGRGDYETQADWQAAKDKRIGQKRIDRILNRSDEFPITEATYKNLMDAGWTGGLPTLGSTATSRGDRNTYEGIRNIDVPQTNKLVNVAQTGLSNQADAVPISGTNNYWDALNMKPREAAYIKPKFLQKQEWYSEPLKLSQGLISTALGENALEKKDAFRTLKQKIPAGSLTIGKYLEMSAKGEIPTILAEDLNSQVLKAIKKQGGFGDTFQKDITGPYNPVVKPEFKDGRLDIDIEKKDLLEPGSAKYLEGWT